MLPRIYPLLILTFTFGCGEPTIEKPTEAINPPTPTKTQTPKVELPTPELPTPKLETPQIELLDAGLAPFKFPTNGKMGQEVLTTWKNTGETAVRLVRGEIQVINGDGSVRETHNYTLYADYSDGVLPGETYSTKPGRGFKLPGFEGLPGYSPAASVKVRITNVAEKAEE